MNLKYGIIEINGEIFCPGYTFDDFQKSVFFEGQDGVRVIKIKDIVSINDNNFIVSLFFRNKVLYMISMMCVDIDIPFSEEIKRKQFHDEFLAKNRLNSENFFDWGNIKSVYDSKGNVSSINIIYNAGV
ncbi:MAG: hypothetical protein EGR46_03660 [Ruminococcus sp.]|uniref:hypothetical protein n=1 Tax=Ruminococcus sp. TaxID=41978 RepID=UPI0025D0436B|nr:hypothetical protein [Ruminococcus sp.]MBD9048023.1 hypothetical protein [Ruminococcus sp.]